MFLKPIYLIKKERTQDTEWLWWKESLNLKWEDTFWGLCPSGTWLHTHWVLSEVSGQTDCLETSGINRPVTHCHISGRRLRLFLCESWKTPTACFMGSWKKCTKWTHNDEVLFAGEITKLLNTRKMVDFFLCARCRAAYLFTLIDSNVLVYTHWQQRTCLHSLTATYLFTLIDSNVPVYTHGQQRTCLHSLTATYLFTLTDSNVLLQNSNFYITDINYYINYAVTKNIIITMAYTLNIHVS
jgi:hypothetical protein